MCRGKKSIYQKHYFGKETWLCAKQLVQSFGCCAYYRSEFPCQSFTLASPPRATSANAGKVKILQWWQSRINYQVRNKQLSLRGPSSALVFSDPCDILQAPTLFTFSYFAMNSGEAQSLLSVTKL